MAAPIVCSHCQRTDNKFGWHWCIPQKTYTSATPKD